MAQAGSSLTRPERARVPDALSILSDRPSVSRFSISARGRTGVWTRDGTPSGIDVIDERDVGCGRWVRQRSLAFPSRKVAGVCDPGRPLRGRLARTCTVYAVRLTTPQVTTAAPTATVLGPVRDLGSNILVTGRPRRRAQALLGDPD